MKKQVVILTALILILILTVSACGQGQNQTIGSWQEQYDLGIKYLSEGNYEEAIIAFTAAIQIDPKQALAYVGRGDAYVQLEEQLDLAQADYETAVKLDENIAEAYLGLADVSIRKGDFDKALEILTLGLEKTGDERLAAKKAELEEGNIYDSSGKKRRMSTYDEAGALIYSHDFTYKDGRKSGVTSYNASGAETGHVDVAYNEQGDELRGYSWDGEGAVHAQEHTYDSAKNRIKTVFFEGKEMSGYIIFEYDSSGNKIKTTSHSPEGEITGYETNEFDGKGHEVKSTSYSSNGELEYFQTREYNSEGHQVRYAEYDADGALEWYELIEYDSKSNPISITKYDSSGNLIERREYN